MSATGIGASVRRKEDQRFITGKGQYTDDINRPGQTYAVFVRSPHAHATIKKIDIVGGAEVAGLLAVFTGEDLAKDKVGGLICGWLIHSKDGSPMKAGAASGAGAGQGALRRRPRRGGDRRDAGAGQGRRRAGRGRLRACCRPWSTSPRAQNAGQPQIHDEAPNNTVYHWHLGDKAAVDAAFARRQARHQDRPRQQPADPQRHRAARGHRRLRRAAATASRSTPPARTRTSRAWCCRPSSASRPSTSCA